MPSEEKRRKRDVRKREREIVASRHMMCLSKMWAGFSKKIIKKKKNLIGKKKTHSKVSNLTCFPCAHCIVRHHVDDLT